MQEIQYKFWTVCMVQERDRVLLLNRQHDYFKGYIPPGGKVDFPESFVEGAIREVYEETGLKVKNLQYKGLYEYVNPVKMERHMIFNYLTTDFEGEIKAGSEGEPEWIRISELEHIPMQKSIRRRMPFFFEEGTFEIHVQWDEEKAQEGDVRIRKT
ncbi:DNA mismatch repair protein MutT [Alkalihalobacillus alcalophilus ATCC 27647 = CGMCC 1.3604]|uniref:DNA mismatch repair protein MutT n=1 Tax=Alkalihalobacillus alcalophilus ATCC 27647 = CGMCC 1.3604 TaxID=1218173 RepID=A0A4S4JWZ2_ALKAL|nr:8-oxo-dGTP diphosphatase [Alkalihalobacillus alcalophilus]MED1562280.1 8-oxo-dGTP diphosphatase [Alkalihalobacillus alcalophilus]THG88817.1 DNA mismatch repair protein MutT [Alkalihalobacillus alcalophilus ATCC 27647 = CGMCC 1.3604]